jgi:hypothetical protein
VRWWYFRVPSSYELRHPKLLLWYGWGVFRNTAGVRPGRWGIFFYGFEFGSRAPGDSVGLFLKRWGFWPY